MLTFLGVQGIRQLVQVNGRANADNPTESLAGQVSAWMTITMTVLIGFLLYQAKPAPFMALAALFIAAMGSGVAMIYDYSANKTIALAAEPNRLFFGIAHVLFALLTLVYLLMSQM
jgi:flagellar motor component MotA